ncbi:MAG: hypothetical protein O9346_07765 [Leptospiraceae bacterium]|nr:hypothetical protein [Leptospiraceae bacterium]MCZ8346296.1 hypothetical protein [Leptospiraceae bacterium]PJE00694.1 MAG: hypothetical protein CK427_13165 [Leptospira sp.]
MLSNLLGLSLTAALFFWVHKERIHINKLYQSLYQRSQYTDFAVLQDYISHSRKFTYAVTDEYGKIHEVTESIDKDLNKKLRVGDTVPVYRRTVEILGKRELIASIQTKENLQHGLSILERFLFLGMLIFGTLVFLSAILSLVYPNKESKV